MIPATDLLADLNAEQRQAVLHDKGPLLILAGAGSGKTRTITHRMARLMAQGCPADGILAITFTNKAAREMQERMEKLTGIWSRWVSTFHSFAARLLRRHIHLLVPYENSFTIYDADDCRTLLRQILTELEIDKSIWTPRHAQEEISRRKNTGRDLASDLGAAFFHGAALRKIHTAYAEAMRERNALDFDDLLLLTVRLFEEHPDVLAQYQRQFRHVLIDEYQDTNAVQYQIGKLLAAGHRNLCITGDPDQSIYAWRGADLSNILNFESDYPDATVVLLERNYRSTQRILDAANALISHNVLRKLKNLRSENGPGEPVRVYQFTDETSEAAEVAALVQGLIQSGTPHRDIAIFYRINALSRPVEQSLIHHGVPYAIVGGVAFFLRKEVKDVLSYLRLVDNPRDAESLRRIINVPTRGVGKSSFEKLVASARVQGQPLLEHLRGGGWRDAVSKKAAAGVDAFLELLAALDARRQGPIADLVKATLELSGYEEYLRTTSGDGARSDIENVWQLHNAAFEYDVAHSEGTLTGFLELVNLLGDVDRWRRDEDRVALMTLHSAKGLEFPVVVIVGVEDGILPLSHIDDAEGDEEEERRLLYVGITRAREQLFLTQASCRSRHGRSRAAYPSRFLKELRYARGAGSTANDAVEWDRETEEDLSLAESSLADSFDSSDVFDAEVEEFEEEPYPLGCQVLHEDYGVGEVVRISGIGQKRRLTIRFCDAGEKQFALGFTRLKRLR